MQQNRVITILTHAGIIQAVNNIPKDITVEVKDYTLNSLPDDDTEDHVLIYER